jgi:hypothetical protein
LPITAVASSVARGYFLGDYSGLDSVGNQFVALFSTTSGDAANAFEIRAGP